MQTNNAKYRSRRAHRPRGYSLLDTMAAGAVMAIVLVPSLSAMRHGLEFSRDAEVLQTTTTLCVGKMEEQLAEVAASFNETTDAGTFSAQGLEGYKVSLWGDSNGFRGGIPDRLMVIEVTVWKDDDGDSVLDAGEINTILKTNVAKLATYIDEVVNG